MLMLNYEYLPLGGGASPVTRLSSEELVKLGYSVDVFTRGGSKDKAKRGDKWGDCLSGSMH